MRVHFLLSICKILRNDCDCPELVGQLVILCVPDVPSVVPAMRSVTRRCATPFPYNA